MSKRDARETSGFGAFWSSLPGILTGVAAVLAAAATLAALFVGGGGSESSQGPGATAVTQPTVAPSVGGDACLGRYFEDIPRDRVATVEAGTTDYDVITETQPKAGTIGVTFTDNARPIGAIRFAFFPENRLFKVESIVDARCRLTEDYENPVGGDKNVLQDSDTLRLRLAGGSYDLTTIAYGGAIRIRFVSVVP